MTLLAIGSLFMLPASCDYFGATGIAVSDLAKSEAFYSKSLGMKRTMVFDTPEFFEVVLGLPGNNTGAGLVLQKWKTPKQNVNLPIKLVFFVDNVKASIDKVRVQGGRIVNEPGTLAGIPTAFALDPDGYTLEFNPLSLLVPSAKST
jgi:catechol 2,3-dioxygenase-like lactoylglutathione lyase family enzyme